MTNRTSFVFYDGFYNAIKKMRTSEEKAELIEAICKYEFEGVIPEMSYVCEIAFEVIKPSLDKATIRYAASVENGKKGGRPKKSENPTEPNKTYDNLGEPNETQQNLNEPTRTQGNLNVNDNVNVNENDNEKNGEETSSSSCFDKSSTNNISSEKNTFTNSPDPTPRGRKSRKDQLVEYVNCLGYHSGTKDILFKWIFQIGLPKGVTVPQLQDMLKSIWEQCGDEDTVYQAINDAYLHNWFGFYKPNNKATMTTKSVNPAPVQKEQLEVETELPEDF